MDSSSRIEKILAIETEDKRVEELVSYARKLRLNVLKTRDEAGKYSENQLVVLIYDAEQRIRDRRASNLGMVFIAFFIFVVFMAVLALTYYMVISARNNQPVKKASDTGAAFE